MSDALRGRDLLTLGELAPDELRLVLDTARALKTAWAAGERAKPLEGRAVAVIMLKSSVRTRVSFEVGCARLGAHPVVIGGADAFSRNETVHDTTKVLERYVDCIVLRTFEQRHVEEVAEHASVPVVNALTDDYHPCQVLADLLTIEERSGRLAGLKVAYVGDGNNMANTLMLGAALAGMAVYVATPPGFEPLRAAEREAREIALLTGAEVVLGNDPAKAVDGADVVITDTWASMGQEAEHDERVKAFAGYTVDERLMAHAAEGAAFMHCLPAHRGEEVVDEVIDAPNSLVFDEAENRLWVQQAWLALAVG